MPVTSSHSRAAWWPRAADVKAAAGVWAEQLAAKDTRVRAIAYFGSYARGDQGFGSDLDLIVLVEGRAAGLDDPYLWDMRGIPVPAEAITYSLDQWARLKHGNGTFYQMLQREAVWLLGAAP